MKIRTILAATLLLGMGFSATMLVPDSFGAEKNIKGAYHCPMHPNYVSDKKGTCPICGMDLVRSEAEPDVQPAAVTVEQGRKILFYRNPMDPTVTSPVPMKDPMGMDYVPVYDEAKGVSAGVLINAAKQQLIGVKKDIVKKRPLAVGIVTVGKVAYDPDLYVAQEEFVQSLKTVAATANSVSVSIREQAAGMLASSERKLLLLGMSKAEIEGLKKDGIAQDSLYFPGNSGKAWVYVTVYEYEFGLVKEGQDVVLDAVAYPGVHFKGKVAGLTPVLNAESRSLRVRVEVEDKDGKLKPEMFVNARISVDLGEKLAIPEEAVMDSGLRKIVYVVKDDRFSARDVELGPKAGEYYEVVSGLEDGEEVVTSGNFLIDSESKLKGSL